MTKVSVPLENGDFNGGFREVGDVAELKVADGWDPWWQTMDTRPEYKLALASEYPYRVFEGRAAQQWFTSYATHTAGIRQLVTGLPADVELVFQCQVQAWTRIKAGDPRKSDGRYRVRIGIDPYGSTDPESKDIVWSDTIQPYDLYYLLQVRCTSKSDRAMLWIWGQPEWPGTDNNCYVDAAELYYQVDENGGGAEPGGSFDWERLARAFEAAAQELRNG